MINKERMIESHIRQIKELELQRNSDVVNACSLDEVNCIISSYNEDIQAYEEDIKILRND